jgi:AcrR family transcriptional regulator
VEAVLAAVVRILKREGAERVTTNRIAVVAGVSIGSVYQYFPDKRAIFQALRDRHVAEMARLVESKLLVRAGAATSSLAALLRELIDAMIDAHALDPALYHLLLTQLPPADDDALEARVRGALRLSLSAHADAFTPPLDLERALFVLVPLLEALAHAAVLRRPLGWSLEAAKAEAARAVLAYLGLVEARGSAREQNTTKRAGDARTRRRPHPARRPTKRA